MQQQLEEIRGVEKNAKLLFSEAEVEASLDRMAAEITTQLAGSHPVVLCVMVGGLVTCGKLLTRLPFPLQVDYIHVSRYRNQTAGSDITWLGKKPDMLAGREILIVDDILDEGYTMQAIVEFCHQAEAKRVLTSVLLDKTAARKAAISPDFAGFCIPDYYVFGCGMDYKSFLRNAPGIYAVVP
ncbi:MAG: hypoxanthine-guanine phosphoribosyltransferase [Zetaproteobacteria bacterium CG12_big_fil_rev_8_21_14_0_65_55_1124]|nr:MAG: hypoxanthine-guanine phosphoribosyltransferase [Zetaproteobacteria bacterium CG1_02_55_237]PIS20092.1 MAG: hypoxanthine-guanine phosphoribosyltransferase [Zetaproteobacteria bacterium CG08_land_8_20_14_0_20_55_17]PIW43206.1 MAG: hypoxanthine-guanine phosphoribosyltransferase [Zetaproteobacteria bacterium CG12_big_fil_rev_8_21_14_0_65_55_1124]PIY53170.1 MAG: hypoxanthine-guanine phosphoribosyltransferase [Zetaproteobacteria bacterium CG_4_10_14_0_8_um_filter_55_43]PIZ39681.1 MAG: hypoxan